MSRSQDRTRLTRAKSAIVICALLLPIVYLLSAGPAIYFALNASGMWAVDVVNVVYYPAIKLAEVLEPYEGYCKWWMTRAFDHLSAP